MNKPAVTFFSFGRLFTKLPRP